MNEHDNSADVVICGGGMAGLTLALHLRRDFGSGLRITVVDKLARPLPEAAFKLGESCVEMGSQYLEQLGLADHLERTQIVKFGLRFFPGGGTSKLHERLEMGASQEPVVRSWQLDRGRFESDLRAMMADRGITLIEGAVVRDVTLGAGASPHTVTYERDGARATISGRWLVDATGRAGLMRRRLGSKRSNDHPGFAGWFRVEGRMDVNSWVPVDADTDWHDRHMADQRWRSTSHLMGAGYWLWIIPLASGHTSVGVVCHDEYFSYDDVRTLDRLMTFLRVHEPQLAEQLQDRTVMDFGAIKNYSYRSTRHWSTDRWALVGEAGSFTDPLYSPGSDLIALANAFTAELIRVDRQGEDLACRVDELESMYAALVHGGMTVYEGNPPVFGHARAMASKIYWDNFAYWSYPCQYFMRGIYRLTGAPHARFKDTGARFVEISGYMQRLMRHWALLAPEPPQGGFLGLPAFPSVVIDAHIALLEDRTPEAAQAALEVAVAQADEIAAELVLRIVQELGPELGATLIDRADIGSWRGLQVSSSRLEAEAMVGMARRRALPLIARDVERALGRIKRHHDAAQARQLLSEVWGPKRARVSA